MLYVIDATHDITFAKGKYSGEGLAYLFCEIIKKIGYEPFKKAFRYYVANDNSTFLTLISIPQTHKKSYFRSTCNY